MIKTWREKYLKCIYVNLMYSVGLLVGSIVWIKELDNHLE